MVTSGLRGKSTAAVWRVFSSAMKGSAYSATAFKIALRGLLIASVEKLDDATDDYTQAAAAKVLIDRDVKALGSLIKAKKNTKEAVQRLNEVYDELFDAHKTAERKAELERACYGYHGQWKIV